MRACILCMIMFCRLSFVAPGTGLGTAPAFAGSPSRRHSCLALGWFVESDPACDWNRCSGVDPTCRSRQVAILLNKRPSQRSRGARIAVHKCMSPKIGSITQARHSLRSRSDVDTFGAQAQRIGPAYDFSCMYAA